MKYVKGGIAANLLDFGRRFIVCAVATGLVATVFLPQAATAYFTSCIANINPNTLNIGTTGTFTVSITNGLGSAVQWIDITVPETNNYTYNNAISGGSWVSGDKTDGTTLTGDSIDNGQTQDFGIVVAAGVQNVGPESWSVQVSTDPGGQNPQVCNGSLQTSLTGTLPQDQLNGVSNVAASDITTSAATVSWQTDNPSSTMVYYGLTNAYGQHSQYDNTLLSSHSVRLSGLQADTTYHYQVVGTDGSGQYAYSIDNTFVTAKNPVTPPPVVDGPTGGTTPKPTPTVQVAPKVTQTQISADKEAPKVTLTTKLKGSYAQAPTINGTATDNVTVSRVDYSTDGGKNWLPVDQLSRPNNQTASFSFTPLVSADGNYVVLARATDPANLTASSEAQTLVIDQLPPLVGGALMTIGPEVIRPNAQGSVQTVIGQDVVIAESAVGGPTAITVEAVDTTQKKVAQSFSLTQLPDAGLWSGVLDFLHPGTYQLTAKAVDGAGNKTEKIVGIVTVDAAAKIVDAKSGQPVNASVQVMYRDPETMAWTQWDSSSYNQQNPTKTTKAGDYSLYLPGGTYYLKITAPGYSQIITKSFDLREPTVVSAGVAMHRRPGLHVGKLQLRLPWIEPRQVTVTPAASQAAKTVTKVSPAIGKPLPNVALRQVDGKDIRPTDLYGKPTIISFVSTWAPPARDQLAILNSLPNDAINVLAVDSGESPAKVAAYNKIAGYDVGVVADAQNKLMDAMGAATMPTTYFLDRHGEVRSVVVGVLSKEELLRYVVGGM